jgi:hypothetical protein
MAGTTSIHSGSNTNIQEPVTGSGNDVTRTNTQTSTSTSPSDVSSTNETAPSQQQQDYPEQKHAGAVGYGPNFHQGPTVGDKITGLKEEFKGTVTHNKDLHQHGKDLKTGELKRKQQEEDNPSAAFSTPDEKKETESTSKTSSAERVDSAPSGNEAARAATVDAEGTRAAERQKHGGNVEDQKNIG